MDMSYFNYCQGLTMTSRKFHDLFGGPPRTPESPVSQREMDLAASIQAVTEEIMLRMANACSRKNANEKPRAGRWRGAQLRRQRSDTSRRPVRGNLDSTCCRRCRWSLGHGSLHLASAVREAAKDAGGETASGVHSSAPSSPTRKFSPRSANIRPISRRALATKSYAKKFRS